MPIKRVDPEQTGLENLAIAKLEDEMQKHLLIAGNIAAYLELDDVCEIIYQILATVDLKAAAHYAETIRRKT